MANNRNTISVYPPPCSVSIRGRAADGPFEPDTEALDLHRVSPDGAPSHQRRRRSDTELACLYRLGQHINQSLELDEVAAITLEIVMEAVQPDVTLLFIQEGPRLLLKKQTHRHGCGQAVSVPLHHVGQCLCGQAIERRRPLYSLDIRDDARCTMQACLRAGVISFAALPLSCENRTLGVLALAAQTRARDFSLQSRFLETMAAQIATALRNAQLHGEVRQRNLTLAQTVTHLECEIAEHKAAVDQIRQLNAQLEERVKAHTAELADKNRGLERLVDSVSHDLILPLQTMEGYSRLLLEGYAPHLGEEGLNLLGALRRSIARMAQWIDGLRVHARLEQRPSARTDSRCAHQYGEDLSAG
jgi:K+-sensing histidine kinase KdpD